MMHRVPRTRLTLPAVARRGVNEGLGAAGHEAKHEVRTEWPANKASHADEEWARKLFNQESEHTGQNAEYEDDDCCPPNSVPSVIDEIDQTGNGADEGRDTEDQAERRAAASEVLSV